MNVAFADVEIAVVGSVNGQAREIVLTAEQRELVKAFVSSLFKIGETIKMSSTELPIAILKATECERG